MYGAPQLQQAAMSVQHGDFELEVVLAWMWVLGQAFDVAGVLLEVHDTDVFLTSDRVQSTSDWRPKRSASPEFRDMQVP